MARDRDFDFDDDADTPSRGRGGPREDIPNYLVQSILVTLFCCLPFGIVAIVFAAQVNSKLSAGDIAGARQASANAKMWSWIAFGLGLAWIAVVVILQVLAIGAGAVAGG